MSHKSFERTDNTENVENVERTEKPEGKEKESLLGKIKDFFSDEGKNREKGDNPKNKEGKENSEGKVEQATEKKEDRKNDFLESLRKGVPSEKEQAAVAKDYREKHNLDEHGNSLDKNAKRPEGGFERVRGDDNPRSKFDVDDGNNEKDNKESKQENNTDDE